MMKDLFPGYFKGSDIELKKMWESSIFVFDANILLNLYRYSDNTRREFLRILEKLKERAWLPHRAAEEYFLNRLSVIGQQEKSYDETVKSITKLKSDLENAHQHPFVEPQIMSKVNEVFDELCKELQKNKAVHTDRILKDEIKIAIAEIFEDHVGVPYENPKLEQLISEGEIRFKQKIPPGYRDKDKFPATDIFTEKCKNYGDYIVWNQVIDLALKYKKNIIFVTGDKKDDWWEIFNGKTIGPLPEIVKEFKEKTERTFHMYQADYFLVLAKENLHESVNEEIVKEIREVGRRDNDELKFFSHNMSLHVDLEYLKLQQELLFQQKHLKTLEEEEYQLQKNIHQLEPFLKKLEYQINENYNASEAESIYKNYSQEFEQYHELRNKFKLLIKQQEQIKNTITQLQMKIENTY